VVEDVVDEVVVVDGMVVVDVVVVVVNTEQEPKQQYGLPPVQS
jgi:hypothetical protein